MIERVWWKKKPSCTVDGNVNGTGTGEQNEVPYKTKNRPKKKLKKIYLWSNNPTPGHISRENYK